MIYKKDSIISTCIVGGVFIASAFFSEYTILQLFKTSLYYLFYIGAAFFSLMHLPFQMYLHDNVTLTYLAEVWPNLIFTLVFHMLMCLITYKRKNIMIPIAIHYVVNYFLREQMVKNIKRVSAYGSHRMSGILH